MPRRDFLLTAVYGLLYTVRMGVYTLFTLAPCRDAGAAAEPGRHIAAPSTIVAKTSAAGARDTPSAKEAPWTSSSQTEAASPSTSRSRARSRRPSWLMGSEGDPLPSIRAPWRTICASASSPPSGPTRSWRRPASSTPCRARDPSLPAATWSFCARSGCARWRDTSPAPWPKRLAVETLARAAGEEPADLRRHAGCAAGKGCREMQGRTRANMTYLLEINNLGKRYDDFELSGVSLAVEPGCVVGFIGSNGAGRRPPPSRQSRHHRRRRGHRAPVRAARHLRQRQDGRHQIPHRHRADTCAFPTPAACAM